MRSHVCSRLYAAFLGNALERALVFLLFWGFGLVFHRLLVSHIGCVGKPEYVIFADRAEAGKQLARRLAEQEYPSPLVLALPRGGVPVAREVARTLGAPLDVFTVRKLGAPGREELAVGAISSGGVKVLNRDAIAELHINEAVLAQIIAREQAELERRESVYRHGRPPVDVSGHTVLLIDDGLATGASMYAAILALRAASAKRIVVAVPVAPEETVAELGQYADEVVCLNTPRPFRGVGAWYADFTQISDDEVREMLGA
jgi:predicted phosphoribosyltransferase